ncbi:nitroreductase family protein [Vitreoscilla sp. C1]|uniref:nitroreductase n=1 Tax=Vitreoscilla sp. (strain C1) TaxID=96942 RepID=UPI000CDCBF3F|nr:nitroreductase [Vitreoscilla sp. C1]AUZ06206.1 nitroreductase family protein [Vitreoscilla sp. C1]
MDYQSVYDAITGRHSVRAFTPQTVEKDLILELLNVAARAPSGTNCQPWQVYVVTGDKRDQIVAEVCALHDAARLDASINEQHTESYPYYPEKWISPYIDRRRENGWGLYGLLGIQKGEKDKMHEQHQRNFRLFDAPVALFFTVNKAMGIGSKMDIAMMMQNVMIAAQARGLATCPQAAWNHYHKVILPIIGAGEDEELVCGMAVGYADTSATVNTFITPRVDASEFTHFVE